MTTETIDIIVRENGARVVKRNLEEIGQVAENSVRGLRLLQNSLFVLGGAGIVQKLVGMLDMLTNFDNRIKLVTTSTAQLKAVQAELFDISERTRSSYEGTAELYTRTALSVRELGISQRETLQFTETLNKATILSGASGREATASLIQLSQALASNRLGGDELRSVLEQLPYVADIIAKHMGVTRGELRAFGKDGKITAKEIIDAFREAREEIAVKFASTMPTVGQALEVLKTSFLEVLYTLNDFFLITLSIAKPILILADHLHELTVGVLAAGAGFAAFKTVGFINSIFLAIKANQDLAAAVASGNAVLLTSVDIENAKAQAALAEAQSSAALSAAKVRELELGLAQLQQNRALLVQQQASIVIDNEKRMARDALTGRFIAYGAAVEQNIRTNVALQRTEQALLATTIELDAAMAAQTGTTIALTGAQERAALAGAASNGWVAKLVRSIPGLAGVVGMLSGAFEGLTVAIISNPIGALIALIVALLVILVAFSDKIKVTSDGLVTLRDVGIATFQIIGEWIKATGDWMKQHFASAITAVAKLWDGLVQATVDTFVSIGQFLKDFTNVTIGLFVGLVNSLVRAWNIFPAALKDIIAIAWNFLLQSTQNAINAVLRAIYTLPQNTRNAFTAMGNYARDTFRFLVRAFENLPASINNLAVRAGDYLSTAFANAIKNIVGWLNKLPGIAIDVGGAVGTGVQQGLKDAGNLNLNQFVSGGYIDLSSAKMEVTGAAKEVGNIFNEEFSKALSVDYVGNAWSEILKRARQIAIDNNKTDLDAESLQRAVSEAADPNKNKDKEPKEDHTKTFAQVLAELQQENALLGENAAKRQKLQTILNIEEQIKRKLLPAEKEQVMALLDQNEILTEAAKRYEDIKGPAYDYAITLQALDDLLKKNRISQEEFTRAVRDSRIEFLETQRDMASGAERALLKLYDSYTNEAAQMENVVNNMFKNMEDALLEFTKTGKLNLSKFFSDLMDDITRFNIRKFILAPLAQKLGIPGTVLGIPLGSTKSTPMWVKNVDSALSNALGSKSDGSKTDETPQTIGEKIKSWWEALKTGLGGIFSKLMDLFKDVTGNLGGAFKNLISVIWNVIKSLMNIGTSGGSSSWISTAFSAVSSFFGGTSSLSNSFSSSSFSSLASSLGSSLSQQAGVSSLIPSLISASMNSSKATASPASNQNISYYIDARGSTDPEAVRQTVSEVLDEKSPALLAQARTQANKDVTTRFSRQRL